MAIDIEKYNQNCNELLQEELYQLRQEFLAAKKDKKALIKWLREYYFLSPSDLCLITGLSERLVSTYKIKAGVNNRLVCEVEGKLIIHVVKPQNSRWRLKIEKPKLELPALTNDKARNREIIGEWVVNSYNVYKSSYHIMNACAGVKGLPYFVYKRSYLMDFLKSKNIKVNKMGDNGLKPHIYCNKEWLVEHYINQNMTLKVMAQKANTSVWTIKQWLNRHKIVSRTSSENSKECCQFGPKPFILNFDNYQSSGESVSNGTESKSNGKTD